MHVFCFGSMCIRGDKFVRGLVGCKRGKGDPEKVCVPGIFLVILFICWHVNFVV